jgi:hypothetical protein
VKFVKFVVEKTEAGVVFRQRMKRMMGTRLMVVNDSDYRRDDEAAWNL